MVLDVFKGCLLNLQTAFLLHGILRWNRRSGLPIWVVYVVPILFIALGMGPLVQQPGSSFLRNVDSLVIAYLAYDMTVCLVGAVLLGWKSRPVDVADQRIRRPLQKALFWMIPLLLMALGAKWLMGAYVPGKYRWVLFFDTAHLLAPAALLLTAYWTNSVALDVTRTSVRRLVAFGVPFGLYLGMKLLWPGSEVDRIGGLCSPPITTYSAKCARSKP
jgi:hypothetical protein